MKAVEVDTRASRNGPRSQGEWAGQLRAAGVAPTEAVELGS
jgi:hypothetical protein